MSDLLLFDLLERLNSLMRTWFRQDPRLAQLQPIQLSVLIYLARCNHYSNTPIGVTEYLGLTKGTVSQSIKNLESKGMIRKQADLRDKRLVHLQLTPQARTLLASAFPPPFLLAGQQAMAQQANVLTGLLAELLTNIQRNNNVAAFGVCQYCRFHQQVAGQPFCGLTQEALQPVDQQLICREYQA